MGIETGLKPSLFKSTKPISIIKVFAPGIKGAAQLPGAMDNLTQSSVSP